MLRSVFEPAYLLSRKAYREDSALIDVLTREHGLIRLMARGLRRKKQPLAAILQPFQPLVLSWQAKSDLGVLTAAESAAPPFHLAGERFYCGCYLNELLTRLLASGEPAESVFVQYAYSMACLAESELSMEWVLREFEHEILDYLGYGLPESDFLPNQNYLWQGEQGLIATEQAGVILGRHLTEIQQKNYHDVDVMRAAKQLSRQRLAPLLGRRPLKSRQVWLEMKRGNV